MSVLRIALLTTLVFAAPAAGATLEPLQPCYVSAKVGGGRFQTEPVAFTGSGFMAGQDVAVGVDGAAKTTTVAADGSGYISGSVYAPGVANGQKHFTITATEQDDTTITAAASSLVTNLTARLRPRTAAPRKRVRFTGRGLTDTTAPIYAHYSSKRAKPRTVRLSGPPKTPCGAFSVRRRQFPFTPAPGRWAIRIDQSRRTGADTPAVTIAVRVKRAVA